MTSLHDQCIDAIHTRLKVTGMSRADLARATQSSQHHVGSVLSGKCVGSWPFIERCLVAVGVRPVLVLADPSD